MARPHISYKDERVDHIIKLMVNREWHPGRAHKELAEKWGIHPRTVSDYADIASGVLKRADGDLMVWVNNKLQELDTIAAAAVAKTHTYKVKDELIEVPDPDFASAVKAINVAADIRGAKLQKGGITGDKKPPRTPEEKRIYVEQCRMALAKLEAELETDEKVH